MTFGLRVRELRKAESRTLRSLAVEVGAGFTYISKIENSKLDFGDYPSEPLIRRLAKALDADETKLLILAEKIPETIRSQFIQRPDVFGRLASLDDATLDRLRRRRWHRGRLVRRSPSSAVPVNLFQRPLPACAVAPAKNSAEFFLLG